MFFRSVLTAIRHLLWPAMLGIAFSDAGLRATGRAFRYIQPTVGKTQQWTGRAKEGQRLHSAKPRWWQEEFAKLSFRRSGMGTSACEVSCNDESRWEGKSQSRGKGCAKRFERNPLKEVLAFCVCGIVGGELNTYQVLLLLLVVSPLWKLPMSSNSVGKLADKRRSVIFWEESLEESYHTPPNTSCFSWRVTSLTRVACRIIPGPCRTRLYFLHFFQIVIRCKKIYMGFMVGWFFEARWRGDHELSAMTLWIVYVWTSIWVDLGKKANLTDIWHAVRERKPKRMTIDKDREDRGGGAKKRHLHWTTRTRIYRWCNYCILCHSLTWWTCFDYNSIRFHLPFVLLIQIGLTVVRRTDFPCFTCAKGRKWWNMIRSNTWSIFAQ